MAPLIRVKMHSVDGPTHSTTLGGYWSFLLVKTMTMERVKKRVMRRVTSRVMSRVTRMVTRNIKVMVPTVLYLPNMLHQVTIIAQYQKGWLPHITQ